MERLILLIAVLMTAGGCSGGKEDCESEDRCACDLKGAQGFCIEAHNRDEPIFFDEGDCSDLGGEWRSGDCPSSDVVGVCQQNDDCGDPEYIFYSNYEGSFDGADTIAELQDACYEGLFVDEYCASWATSLR